MPLEAPPLDTRTFEEWFEQARLRIPRYLPEWTDFNESDPGIALVQLFAWFTESMIYQMNRVPDRNYIKFLQMLNIELRPAQPARAHLTFAAQPGANVQPVRKGSQIGAQSPETGDLVIFETVKGLDLIRVPLAAVQVSDGTALTTFTPNNETPESTYPPFGWAPQIDSALYLGFEQTNPPAVGRPFPQQLSFRVFLSERERAGKPQYCEPDGQSTAAAASGAPLTLIWEYKQDQGSTRWRQLNVFEDGTEGFTKEGYLLIEGPEKIEPTKVGNVPAEHFWLRCRLVAGNFPNGRVPRIDFIRANTVEAINLSTIREEVLGVSDGRPDQSFTLARTPVEAASLELVTEVEGEDNEEWQQVEDFLATKPDDKHFLLNPTTGTITFGNGDRGRIPQLDALIVAVHYRFGGGSGGNVAAGLISAPLSGLVGVESVTNERSAVGGREEQEEADLKEQAPRILKSRNRAVTKEDFAALAAQAGNIARAVAIPLAHPDHPGVEVPGAVTVVVVPDNEDRPPQPTSDMIRNVCRHLDQYRLLTTEVYVKGPNYMSISVEARVASERYASAGAVTEDVIKALNKHLNPLGKKPTQDGSGMANGSNGEEWAWQFGQDLFPTSLFSVILDVEGVAAVTSLNVTVNGRPHDDIRKSIVVPADGLLYGSNHQVVVEPLVDR